MDRFSIIVLLCLYSSFQITVGQTTAKSVCTEVGAFEIYDGTCKNYYICINDGEKLNQVILSCASSAIFDPVESQCVPDNKITSLCQQTTSSTTSVSSTTSAPLCVRYGRFSIPNTYCKKYYLCYWNGVRYTIMNNLTCPRMLIFNQFMEKCVSPTKYTCPTK